MNTDIAVYTARGNVYAIISPDLAFRLGDVPRQPADAAAYLSHAGKSFVQTIQERLPKQVQELRPERSPIDGIILGPFRQQAPFDALIE